MARVGGVQVAEDPGVDVEVVDEVGGSEGEDV